MCDLIVKIDSLKIVGEPYTEHGTIAVYLENCSSFGGSKYVKTWMLMFNSGLFSHTFLQGQTESGDII